MCTKWPNQWGHKIIYRNTEEANISLNIEISGVVDIPLVIAYGRPTPVFACSSQTWSSTELRVKYPQITNAERTVAWMFIHAKSA